ncbi:alpha-ketoglutarate-dependent dioxygenase alkB homolog 4 isoform X2 [Ambystoma mexicanum]
MDQDAWKISQSGRRKQDYGPNVNFKKQKVKVGRFSGLPSFSRDIVRRMNEHAALQGFQPVEQCNLDYNPQRGSAIDPHFDDWWLWGERLVTLNLLAETLLTMSCDSKDQLQLFTTSKQDHSTMDTSAVSQVCKRANLIQREARPETNISNIPNSSPDPLTRFVSSSEVHVAIRLPRRSLIILAGDARFKWKHAIYREHIEHRRICCTFRELSAEFGIGGKEEKLGKELLGIALSFQGKPI